MSTKRLEKRLGPLKKRATASLADHTLAFDKRSTNSSGKANLVRRCSGEAWGVVFDLTPDQMKKLSDLEKGYVTKTVTVMAGDERIDVATFVAAERTRGLRPTGTYLNHLIDGAREHAFPAAYVRRLERVKTQ